MTSPKPHLVIIGTGWAGFYLDQYISQPRYTVTIISPRRTSAYTPLLASAACGQFNFYLSEEPVRSKHRSSIRYIKANVLDVDFSGKSVRCAPAFEGEEDELATREFEVGYDVVVLAPGCRPNTFGTPGVEEHAIFMKNVSDAMAVRKLLFDRLEKASLPTATPKQVRELLHIAIVGGGPTGIELTAELSDLASRELRDLYPEIASEIHISIYDVAPQILSSYDRKLYEYANESLTRRTIAIETNAHISHVTATHIHLQGGREPVPYGMLIWATGNKHVPLLEKLGPQTRQPQKGLRRLLTDDRLRVLRPVDPAFPDDARPRVWEGAFALGDAADTLHASLPTTAEVAVQKARWLVDLLNQYDVIRGGGEVLQVVPGFVYTQKQLVSYIGGHDGVIERPKGKDGVSVPGWTGRSAWLAWRGGSVLWTRSWRSRIMICLTWLINYFAGREVARM